jgi:hypothetical protein
MRVTFAWIGAGRRQTADADLETLPRAGEQVEILGGLTVVKLTVQQVSWKIWNLHAGLPPDGHIAHQVLCDGSQRDRRDRVKGERRKVDGLRVLRGTHERYRLESIR